MEKNKLKEILLDQRDDFFRKKDYVERDINLKPYLKTKQIVLISGIRRSGKSTLLYILKEHMKIDNKNILYFNFDDERVINFKSTDFNELYALFLELFNPDKNKIVFFFDEIQNIKGWEKFLNRMYEKGIKLFVTGSNANLLSSEIATSLTGRNMVINLYPFSFKEYLKFKKYNYDLKLLSTQTKAEIKYYFKEYFYYGGFPLVLIEKNLEILDNYYRDIFYKDIVYRKGIEQVEEMKTLLNFLLSNTSKIYSYQTLQKITHIKSISTIKNYIDFLSEVYIIFPVMKFDYSLKKQFLNPRKIYSVDIGLSRRVSFKFSEDKGRLLENLVFIELKRRGKEIYYHRQKKECDFVVKEGLDIVEAIQVTTSLEDPETRKREVSGLVDAMKTYNLKEGLILTEDEEDEFIEKDKRTGEEFRIRVMPVWKWFLNFE